MEEIRSAHQSLQQEDIIVHVQTVLLRKMEFAYHTVRYVSRPISFVDPLLTEQKCANPNTAFVMIFDK